MKKHIFSRCLVLFWVIIMACSVFVACGNKNSPKNRDHIGEPPTLEQSPEHPDIPEKDYDGYEFIFLCQPNIDGKAYFVDYMVVEGEVSNHILNGVDRRNEYLAKKYNIIFAQSKVNDLISTVRAQALSGVGNYDIIFGDYKSLATLAKENMLLDLKSVNRFDMTKSYWDSNAAEQLLIGDKLYFTNCAMNIQELGNVMYFNKHIIRDFELISPYEYIEKNEWTIDNWAKMVKSVSVDVDKNKKWDVTDTYGTLYEPHNLSMFLCGAGVRATRNNEQGIPELTLFDNDKTVNVYEKCKSVFSSVNSMCVEDISESITHEYASKADYARSMFYEGCYLFHYEGTDIIHQFDDMEFEIGIVPFPKYDTEQDEYYSLYPHDALLVAVPSKIENLERTANIIEDLNHISKLSLKSAWFDSLVERKYRFDDESLEMLDIIYENRVYDIGLYYDFGGIRSGVLEQDVRKSDISELYEAKKNDINTDIKNFYRDFGFVD